MKKTILFIAVCCFAMGAAPAQTITGTFQHDGIERSYRLYLPPNLPPNSHPPLVFNLHGFTSNGQQQELYSGMNAVADTAGFLVCYPDGVGNAWNIGVPGGSTADDIGFVSALIDSFHAQYGVDLERVYSCGMSNGGFFSYRLACEMGHRIAAIASVAGSMTTNLLETCSPSHPMPVMEIHGDADAVVDYNGAAGIVPTPDVFHFWASNNGCLLPGTNGDVPNTAPNDQCTASFESYFACTDLAEVILITVQNGGHTWPGAFPTVVFGPTCQDFNASREIWVFFDRHKIELPSATAVPAPISRDLLISPNPFADRLNLRWAGKKIGFASVSDGMGHLVWAGVPSNGSIDADNWPSGLYFITVEVDGVLSVHKAIK